MTSLMRSGIGILVELKGNLGVKVIGRRGSSQYLLVEQDNALEVSILDIKQGKLFPPDNIQVILKWGYWEEYSMSDEELKRLLKSCDMA